MLLMSSVVLTGGCSVGLALRRRLSDLGGGGGGTLKVRSSPVLDSWNELVDVSAGPKLLLNRFSGLIIVMSPKNIRYEVYHQCQSTQFF